MTFAASVVVASIGDDLAAISMGLVGEELADEVVAATARLLG